MAKFTVNFVIDDEELDNAIRFLGSTEEGIESIRQDYMLGIFTMDLRNIKDPQKRYYHANGLTAMLISVQDEIQKS